MVNVCLSWAEFTLVKVLDPPENQLPPMGPELRLPIIGSPGNPTFGDIELIPHNAQIVNDYYAKDLQPYGA